MTPIIEFKDFSFKYRSQVEPTLRDINLKIYPGEKVLIVGPSGSGKSTIAHCINGLVPFSFAGDSSGSLRIKGKDPAKLGIFGMSKLVGTVLQDTNGQFIGLTVAEDIAFALENDCIPQEEMKNRVKRVAEVVEVDRLLTGAPWELSGGQKQRVSMAGVMVDDVEILLFDEPLANLDPATGKRAIDLIDRIRTGRMEADRIRTGRMEAERTGTGAKGTGKDGAGTAAGESRTTVLIIEHRLEDALYRDVDRIVVIGEGRVVADLTPDELLTGDILRRQGIREPLYITALKHAGCEITRESRPQHIETMELAPYREQVRSWFQGAAYEKRKLPEESVLTVKDLYFSYVEGKPVLQHIDFDIHKGEMAAVVGKNGAGKSTLAGLICGFLKPVRGSILLNGKDIADWSIKERGEKIGLVMQSPGQMISKPLIYEEVALGLTVRGAPEEEIKQRVYETLKICGLYPFRNWPVSALSYGQKKRVTIASILVMNPEVIILDEPTAGQDYRHYTEIMEFLKDINRTCGVTILMITHDMHLMLEYTDRAIVIADGHLLEDAAPADVLTDERIADRAYLKKTSLYDLAVRCDIDRPTEFVERFIHYDRSRRKEERRGAENGEGSGAQNRAQKAEEAGKSSAAFRIKEGGEA